MLCLLDAGRSEPAQRSNGPLSSAVAAPHRPIKEAKTAGDLKEQGFSHTSLCVSAISGDWTFVSILGWPPSLGSKWATAMLHGEQTPCVLSLRLRAHFC